MMPFVAGLDLGQVNDYSALVVLDLQQHGFLQPKQHVGTLLQLRYIKRWDLHTQYPQIIAETKAIVTTPPLARATALVVDGTGVGRPVVDMMRIGGLAPIPVSITGGEKVSRERGWWGVPKRDLVSALAVAFEGGSLLIGALPLAPVLRKELTTFKAKISVSGNETFEAWRERDHDDLVLATALAVWWARRGSPNIRFISY